MKYGPVNIAAILLLASAHIAVGQPDVKEERGIPFPSEHYAPPEYQQSAQNWDVVQDDRGLIYVANNDGVLTYDGERWELIPTRSYARSLAVDSLVFVGTKGDFGYLRPDSTGELHYKSLYNQIPADERDFEDIWNTHVLGEVVYYQAKKRLFRWDGTEVTSWSSDKGFHTSFVVDSTLYLRDFGRGLLRMKGDSLTLVPGGEMFHETPIYMMARHPSGDLLIGTQKKGLLLYDEERGTVRPFAPTLTPYLQERKLYHGCRLPGNRYALATLGGGVVVVDAGGSVVRVLDKSSGLPDNVVNQVYTDRGGQLWMALNSAGVFRADLNVPLTIHDERTGLEGRIQGIYEHDDTTYVATGSGLYVLREQEGQVLGERSAYFEAWGNLPLVRDMLSVGKDLLAATQDKGVFLIREGTRRRIAGWVFTYDLLKPEDQGIVYAGTRSGLKGLTQTPNGWISFSIAGVQEEVRSLASGGDGILWAVTTGGDVLRMVLSDEGRSVTATTRYSVQDGLPKGYKEVTTIDGKITVVSKEGFFQVDGAEPAPKAWRFSRRSALLPDTEGADTLAVKAHTETPDGDRWLALGERVFVGRRTEGGTYRWKSVEPLSFPRSNKVSISVSRDSTVWLGDGRRLFRYAPWERREIEVPKAEFQALVRQVKTLRRGRVLYGGGAPILGTNALTIPYGEDLHIEVAAPLYGTVDPHQYRYKLVGRDEQWSDWTEDPNQRYRDLWEGTYHFRVQARSSRGRRSKVASLTFQVHPPWYRSIWAVLFYGVAFVLVAYGARRYYQIKEERRRVQKRIQKLERERVVAEQLKRANERLREANRLKEDFLATTSHELRTPLTNILGSIEVLRDTATDEQENFLDIIEKNGKRLKRTLNALLDLSMLRSKEEDPDLTPISIDEFVQRVASDHRKEAEEKGLSFWVDTPDTSVHAELDEQYLEQILHNLVENAIKFTDEGHVAISVRRNDGQVCLEVEDTGIGIDEDFLPDLFEEFRQESRGRARTYEGNGLGLAISSRLVEQMNGTIDVETTKGEGSTFTVEFPRSSTGNSSGSGEE